MTRETNSFSARNPRRTFSLPTDLNYTGPDDDSSSGSSRSGSFKESLFQAPKENSKVSSLDESLRSDIEEQMASMAKQIRDLQEGLIKVSSSPSTPRFTAEFRDDSIYLAMKKSVGEPVSPKTNEVTLRTYAKGIFGELPEEGPKGLRYMDDKLKIPFTSIKPDYYEMSELTQNIFKQSIEKKLILSLVSIPTLGGLTL